MAIIKGNNKNNILSGGINKDVLYGYGGDDILNGGGGDDNLQGGDGADILIGGTGNDILDGGIGVDVLIGGDGNDIYLIDNPSDVISETSDTGFDTVKSFVGWVLGGNVEKLVLTGSAAINGLGNTLDNIIIGNDNNNILNGAEGDDILVGGLGIDNLMGGTGNDALKIIDINGDHLDGGTGLDSLQITGDNQALDIRNADSIKNIEIIRLGNTHSTLIVDAQSIIDMSDESNTLKVDASADSHLNMDSGWTDNGIVSGYHTFTKDDFIKGDATLQVNPIITDIEIFTAYTISDLATADNVGNVFDSGVQEITIDFGGKAYNYWDLDAIDLTGFGLEDKLIIAQHDGALSDGAAHYHTNASQRSRYIHESDSWTSYTCFHGWTVDRVSWQAGASKAKLISSGSTYYSSTRSSVVANSSFPNQVVLTGLPLGLPDSHFVFV